MSDETKSIVNEEERRRLINEIARMKEILDSFKYGLNFEDFADELFKTIDRQTIAIKHLDEKMEKILERMEKLEGRFKDGIKVTVAGVAGSDSGVSGSHEVMFEEEIVKPTPPPSEEEIASALSLEELKQEANDLKVKIARLFEKENEYDEMAMTDPASADEYEEKVRLTREKRRELEEQLGEIMQRIGDR
ncbi:hypothetical protein EU527_07060 [Candidatus Thorarchaeota archaeon]|nr:MAG: hypothetical protein EU527_07060 [Candidatus Thorarchaeota archaeon]